MWASLQSTSGEDVTIGLSSADDPARQLVDVTSQVQDWIVEELWSQRQASTWPECPEHPQSHPLKPTLKGGVAVWTCPVSGSVVAEIGSLPHC